MKLLDEAFEEWLQSDTGYGLKVIDTLDAPIQAKRAWDAAIESLTVGINCPVCGSKAVTPKEAFYELRINQLLEKVLKCNTSTD